MFSLEVLKTLYCFKQLFLNIRELRKAGEEQLKKFEGDSSIPAFSLELFRLEVKKPDSEFDSFYEAELFPNVLLFETLDVCILFSYHKRKTVPEGLRDVVMSHPNLKYGRYGDQVLRYPDSNHEVISKHKWCRPRLFLADF